MKVVCVVLLALVGVGVLAGSVSSSGQDSALTNANDGSEYAKDAIAGRVSGAVSTAADKPTAVPGRALLGRRSALQRKRSLSFKFARLLTSKRVSRGGKVHTKAPTKAPPTKAPTKAPTPTWGHAGCVPHPAYDPAKVRWVNKYRKLQLSKRLAALDCNPAKCKNDVRCHIPPCKALTEGRRTAGPYPKIADKRKCPSSGCATVRRASLEKITVHIREDNLDPPHYPFYTIHPGTGFGLRKASGRDGYSECYPSDVKAPSDAQNYGGWFYPDGNLCNPLHLSVCTKATITQGGLNSARSTLASRSAAILIKRTWCVKIDDNDHAKCLKSRAKSKRGVCRKTKCYVYKTGRCVVLNQPTWFYAVESEPAITNRGKTYPEYDITRAMRRKAMKQYQAKQFTECTSPAVQLTAEKVISSA